MRTVQPQRLCYLIVLLALLSTTLLVPSKAAHAAEPVPLAEGGWIGTLTVESSYEDIGVSQVQTAAYRIYGMHRASDTSTELRHPKVVSASYDATIANYCATGSTRRMVGELP